ncbi:MAG: diguanylate cyclase (GGDEF)-like protein [Pseudohongiellaceae bacterium]
MKEDDKQLEDIIELDESSLLLADIEFIAKSGDKRKYFEEKYFGNLYSKILLVLTHESYEEDEAKSLWNSIVAHMSELNNLLNRNVGISIATMDYMSNIRDELSSPVLIEEKKSEFISKTSTKDELTGLYLRNVFDVVLRQKVEESKRNDQELSLLLMDIDDFKIVNDTYGHQVGDNVLKKIGATINNLVREMDLPARYGGEEIAVIMPGANRKQVFKAAERIRKVISQLKFECCSVTISIGIGRVNQETNTSDKILKAADNALYQAKNKGKNRVTINKEID